MLNWMPASESKPERSDACGASTANRCTDHDRRRRSALITGLDAMFTDEDKRELKRLMQKRRRASDTGTRKAMLAWNRGEKGKEARKKYLANGGAEVMAASRAPGTLVYSERKRLDRQSIAVAAKHRDEWTAKDEALLLEMAATGMTTKEIAAALGRSYRGIEGKRERLRKASNPVVSIAPLGASDLTA